MSNMLIYICNENASFITAYLVFIAVDLALMQLTNLHVLTNGSAVKPKCLCVCGAMTVVYNYVAGSYFQ
jgi:hypothetical protein